MVEIILVVFCVLIMSRYRRAGEKGGGKYVLGIGLTWLALILVGGMVATSTGNLEDAYVPFTIGYVVCFIIALFGMRSGGQLQENAAAMRRQEKERIQEEQRERQIQARVDAAVAAALAQQQQSDAQSAPEIPDTPTAQREAPVDVTKAEGTFYAFAAQGPAFGSGFTGDVAMEKAEKLKEEYAPARDMHLVLIRSEEWPSPVSASASGGIISASFSMNDYTDEIANYLLREGISPEKVEQGLRLSREHAIQLMNPMSGLFVMGIPIY